MSDDNIPLVDRWPDGVMPEEAKALPSMVEEEDNEPDPVALGLLVISLSGTAFLAIMIFGLLFGRAS